MTLFIVLGLAVLAAVVAVVWINVVDGYPLAGIGFGLMTLIGGTVFAVLIGMLLTLIISPIVGYTNSSRTQQLVALTDARNAFGGLFFLGTGSVKGKPAFTFYTAEPNGSRVLRQVEAGGVPVFEDASEPYLVWVDGCVSHRPGFVPCWPKRYVSEIHVPAGSIKQGIDLGVEP